MRERSKRQALVVFAHPVPGSFTEAIRDRVSAGLLGAGWTLDKVDLYEDGFDPCVTAAELVGSASARDPVVTAHIERLSRASALVFVYPTWWGAQPAIMKGWLDRILLRGDGRRALRSIRRLVVVSPHGSSRLRNGAQGVPGRRTIFRHLRLRCHRFATCTWVAFYSNDQANRQGREAFLDEVEKKLSRLGTPSTGLFTRASRRFRRGGRS